MHFNKLRTVLALGVLAIGAGFLALRSLADPPRLEKRVAGAQPENETAREDVYGDPLPDGAIVRMGSVRLRHNNATMAFSADGKALISAGGVGDIRFWDAATGKELRRVEFQGPRDRMASLRDPCLTPDGRRLAVWEQGHNSSAAVVYETDTGRELHRFRTDGAAWCTFRLSQDGNTLASLISSADLQSRTVCVWDLTTGKKRLDRTIRGTVWGTALSPDGRRLVWSHDNEKPTVYDTHSGKDLGRLPTVVHQACFSPDGKVLAGYTSNGGKGIQLWDSTSLLEIRKVDQPEGNNLLFGFGGNDTLVSYCGDTKELALVDAAGKNRTRRIPCSQPQNIALSPDGKTLACADLVSIRTYDVASGKALHDFAGHRNGVGSVSASADGTRVASAAGWGDGFVHVWESATGKRLRSFPGPDSSVTGCELSRDGKLLVTASSEGTLQLWDLATGQRRNQFRFGAASSGWLSNKSDYFRLAADGKRLAAVGKPDPIPDGQFSLYVWDTATGQLIERRPFPVDFISRPTSNGGTMSRVLFHSAFSPDGSLVTVWDKTQLQISEVMTLRTRAVVAGDLGLPSAFSDDNRLLAAGIHKSGGDQFEPEVNAVGLFETATGKEVMRLETGAVFLLAFSPDARFLATSDSQSLRVWDIGTGKEVFSRIWPKNLVPHPTWSPVASMAFLPDGKRLVTGVCDGTLLVWDMSRLSQNRAATTSLNRDTLGRLWDDLRGEDARKAFRAQLLLAGSPVESVRFLKDQVRPAPPVDGKSVEALLAKLDDKRFAVREAASKELAEMVDRIEPLLTRARETHPSPEVRRRIAAVLAAPYSPLTGESLYALRAIATLERIGTPEAQNVLRTLAGGGPGRATREALVAMERLARQPAAPDQKPIRDRLVK